MSFDESFLERVAEALDAAGLDAVVVGNVASILQHAPVLTDDVDLLIRDTPRNRQKLDVFAREIGGSRPAPVSELSKVLRIHAEVLVDAHFDRISGGLRFESLRSRALRVGVGSGHLRVARLADVIRSKEAAGRPKDRASLPILRDTLRTNQAAERGKKGRYSE